MTPTLQPDHASGLLVELAEWDQVGPARDPRLKCVSFTQNPAAQRLVQEVSSRLDIREGYQGLEIASTSFVGRVDIGGVRIAVAPKLPAMPLTILLRYAYGLRDVSMFRETQAPTKRHGFHDLLVAILAAEVEELLHRGLTRRYIPLVERLECPRGRILVDRLASSGGLAEARLPCRYFDRRVDWHLNQVLRAGLDMAAGITDDRDLRRHVARLADSFVDVEHKAHLTAADLGRAEGALTRLTAACAPALTLIRLLHEMLGAAFEPADNQSRMPGFLFDMNTFFQRLLSRFLHENLADTVVDEWAIRDVFAFAPDANPKRRSAPRPRPDFALFHGKKLGGFLDAKYRDIWNRALPADWLYQLSIYALASPHGTSVLLYATMSDDARDELIRIRQPFKWSDAQPASVIVRPVVLQQLAELVDPVTAGKLGDERRRFAGELVNLSARSASTTFR